MADYKMLKEQNVVMKNEVETLRTYVQQKMSCTFWTILC